MMRSIALWLRSFRDDRHGVSAVEFALIAPIMIFFYFGMSEICQGFMAQKRTEHVASTIADLVAQEETISTAGLTDVYTVAAKVLEPFPTTGLKQRVTSVTRNTSGVAKVDWSSGSNWTPLTTGATVTLPANLIANGESIIMAEVEYPYQSPFDYVMPSQKTFSKVYYLRPRQSTMVTKTN
ncbi:MAG: pilus assembly protein [Caulobacteraceae bacterium]|nr:pilus assembly protein [Caulobacteraceae bacterium]